MIPRPSPLHHYKRRTVHATMMEHVPPPSCRPSVQKRTCPARYSPCTGCVRDTPKTPSPDRKRHPQVAAFIITRVYRADARNAARIVHGPRLNTYIYFQLEKVCPIYRTDSVSLPPHQVNLRRTSSSTTTRAIFFRVFPQNTFGRHSSIPIVRCEWVGRE